MNRWLINCDHTDCQNSKLYTDASWVLLWFSKTNSKISRFQGNQGAAFQETHRPWIDVEGPWWFHRSVSPGPFPLAYTLSMQIALTYNVYSCSFVYCYWCGSHTRYVSLLRNCQVKIYSEYKSEDRIDTSSRAMDLIRLEGVFYQGRAPLRSSQNERIHKQTRHTTKFRHA